MMEQAEIDYHISKKVIISNESDLLDSDMDGSDWDSVPLDVEDFPYYDEDWAPPTKIKFSEIKKNITTFFKHQFAMLEPAMAIAKTMYINIIDARAEAMTAFFIQVPSLIHDLHHDVCEGVDGNEVIIDDTTSSFVVKLLCTPNAKIVANYATFLATAPAWLYEADLNFKLSMMGFS